MKYYFLRKSILSDAYVGVTFYLEFFIRRPTTMTTNKSLHADNKCQERRKGFKNTNYDKRVFSLTTITQRWRRSSERYHHERLSRQDLRSSGIFTTSSLQLWDNAYHFLVYDGLRSERAHEATSFSSGFCQNAFRQKRFRWQSRDEIRCFCHDVRFFTFADSVSSFSYPVSRSPLVVSRKWSAKDYSETFREISMLENCVHRLRILIIL